MAGNFHFDGGTFRNPWTSRSVEGAQMSTEKFYCGNCGSPLYYGRKFKEHALSQPCPACQALNPAYFRYCYRCGAKIRSPEEEDAGDETL